MNTARRSRPEVSFIIVARNAEKHLPRLLQNYLEQDYPPPRRELIIVDSRSSDATRRLAEEFAAAHPELEVTILENPKLTLSPGWNLGIRHARGEIVVRLDAHIAMPPHYLSRGAQLLKERLREGVVCVGGPLTTKGEGFWGRAIAAVLSSPFGVGNSPFRHGNRQGYVETVPSGLYWRRVFEVVGLFREDLVRAQDNEMHARIRARGWKFYLSPELRCTYYCRNTIPAFLKQAWANGYWMVRVWRQASWRHLVPMAFVGTLGVLGLGGLVVPVLAQGLGLLLLTYTAAALVSSRRAGTDLGGLRFLLLPPLFFLLHTTYGLGSWWAWLTALGKRRS
uniref:Glycosyltransferase family 2 protein n=1 Tax=Desulfobacca acetoxidans TaxID=60893 RepID=A0A7V4G8V9_9BACT